LGISLNNLEEGDLELLMFSALDKDDDHAKESVGEVLSADVGRLAELGGELFAADVALSVRPCTDLRGVVVTDALLTLAD
jgi:hypothetical protein